MREKEKFFEFGVQYYISGRFAAAARLAPVAGNLLHHAIEMFLKGALADVTTEPERRQMGHKLPTLWSEFKGRLNASHLATFDPLIASLHQFEEIRYPEKIIQDGMALAFGFGRNVEPLMVEPDNDPPLPRYTLSVGQIDELVAEIFELASVNPKFFDRGSSLARDYLKHENEHSIW